MKKRKLMIGKKSTFWKWLRGYERADIDSRVFEMGWDKMPPPERDNVLFPEVSDRGKWFESPNAEGYLDM